MYNNENTEILKFYKTQKLCDLIAVIIPVTFIITLIAFKNYSIKQSSYDNYINNQNFHNNTYRNLQTNQIIPLQQFLNDKKINDFIDVISTKTYTGSWTSKTDSINSSNLFNFLTRNEGAIELNLRSYLTTGLYINSLYSENNQFNNFGKDVVNIAIALKDGAYRDKWVYLDSKFAKDNYNDTNSEILVNFATNKIIVTAKLFKYYESSELSTNELYNTISTRSKMCN